MSERNGSTLKAIATYAGLASLAIAYIAGYGKLQSEVGAHGESIKAMWQRQAESNKENEANRNKVTDSLARIETKLDRALKDVDEIRNRRNP